MRYLVKSLRPKDNSVHGCAMIDAENATEARHYYRAQLMEERGLTVWQVAALTVRAFGPVVL